jgi:predicted DNA-binding transcriptional regulator AlpA
MQLIRFPRLQSKCGDIGRTKIYEMIKTGFLPKPIKIGRASVWSESEVDLALEKLAKAARSRVELGDGRTNGFP